ncbi:hypothetical protein GQ53DRAFT_181141 [Thozetella sp. PMI_491]|nr:hypothetical protein GQ53DRAFT_181141 [Thozetella sp. PMI_491]
MHICTKKEKEGNKKRAAIPLWPGREPLLPTQHDHFTISQVGVHAVRERRNRSEEAPREAHVTYSSGCSIQADNRHEGRRGGRLPGSQRAGQEVGLDRKYLPRPLYAWPGWRAHYLLHVGTVHMGWAAVWAHFSFYSYLPGPEDAKGPKG